MAGISLGEVYKLGTEKPMLLTFPNVFNTLNWVNSGIGQIQPTAYFYKSFIGTQLCPFAYVLPMAAFALHWQS